MTQIFRTGAKAGFDAIYEKAHEYEQNIRDTKTSPPVSSDHLKSLEARNLIAKMPSADDVNERLEQGIRCFILNNINNHDVSQTKFEQDRHSSA